MEERKLELTLDQLHEINGGTMDESGLLLVELSCAGYGPFIKYNPDRMDFIDIEGMTEFFKERGYTFKPGMDEKTQNVFIGPDGLPYGNDYIVHLLQEGKL